MEGNVANGTRYRDFAPCPAPDASATKGDASIRTAVLPSGQFLELSNQSGDHHKLLVEPCLRSFPRRQRTVPGVEGPEAPLVLAQLFVESKYLFPKPRSPRERLPYSSITALHVPGQPDFVVPMQQWYRTHFLEVQAHAVLWRRRFFRRSRAGVFIMLIRPSRLLQDRWVPRSRGLWRDPLLSLSSSRLPAFDQHKCLLSLV